MKNIISSIASLIASFITGRNNPLPKSEFNIIVTDQEMIFDGELVTELKYRGKYKEFRAYRFDDMNELAMAQLYYS